MPWRRLVIFGRLLQREITRVEFTKRRKHFSREPNTSSQFLDCDKMSDEAEAKIEENLQIISEGKAKVYHPASVFYNPVQEFNRDLTVAIISEYARDHIREQEEKLRKKSGNIKQLEMDGDRDMCESNGNSLLMEVDRTGENLTAVTSELIAGKRHEMGVRILEGLAASGLRSIRFGLEIPGVKEIVTNDLDADAVKIIEKNIEANGLQDLVVSSQNDAALLMYQNRQFKNRFDVIDLDPYGTAAPFLDSAVQAVRSGGLLCITCTDAAVLCGNFGEACYAKYGSFSLRTPYCHEMAVRIILKSVESHANRYGRYIVPLLCLSVDFYFRLFLKVYNGPNKCKESICKTAMVYHCSGCGSFELQKLGVRHEGKGGNYKYTPATGPQIAEKCQHCGCKHHIGGPVSVASLHDKTFVGRVIESVREAPDRFSTSKRIEGMLSMVMEELDMPFYRVTDDLCNVVHCSPIKDLEIRSALLNSGYKVSLSPFMKNSIKTDAPNHILWDIVRTYVKKNPVNPKRLTEGSPARTILDQEPSVEISFDLHPDANPKSRADGLVRFQQNPEKDWGPKARPKRSEKVESLDERRQKYQGKRKRNEAEEQSHEKTVQQNKMN